MSSLAENFHASKELEQVQTSDDRLEVAVRCVIIILIRCMHKRKTCGYSMIARSRTDVLKSLLLRCK